MAQIIIRDLDDAILVRLKRRAWEQGLPLEESLRHVILVSLDGDEQPDQFRTVLNPSHSYLTREMTGPEGRIVFHA